jgi:hypothetical protein
MDRNDLAVAILEKIKKSKSEDGDSKDINPAVHAILEALKTGDPEKLDSSLSDFIKINMGS